MKRLTTVLENYNLIPLSPNEISEIYGVDIEYTKYNKGGEIQRRSKYGDGSNFIFKIDVGITESDILFLGNLDGANYGLFKTQMVKGLCLARSVSYEDCTSALLELESKKFKTSIDSINDQITDVFFFLML